jgi:ATP-dependent helicase Lhr and Lhr-like helicase
MRRAGAGHSPGELDRLIFPEASLDVLAQQIVACCAAAGSARTPRRTNRVTSRPLISDGWDEDDLFALVKRAYPYRNLKRETFDEVLVDAFGRNRLATRPLWRVPASRPHQPQAASAARRALAAITSGGAIPDNALFTVVAEPDGGTVGTVDEDFAVESMAGDVMLLGNTSWRIRRVEAKTSRMLVEDAHGAPPSVPFWRGEAPARTAELSQQLGELRKEISDRLPGRDSGRRMAQSARGR